MLMLNALTSVWCTSPRARSASNGHAIAVINSPADCDDLGDAYDCFHADAVQAIGKDRVPKVRVPRIQVLGAVPLHLTCFARFACALCIE